MFESASVSPSVVSDSATPWTVAHQAPLPMEFSRQEYWSGLPFLSPGDLPDPGMEPRSPALQAGSLAPESPGKPSWCLKAKVLAAQSCPTLCDPMNCNSAGSSVYGILQARIQEWLPFPSPGDLPDPGIEPRSRALQADSVLLAPPGKL